MDRVILRWSLIGLLLFIAAGIWQFVIFQTDPVEDFHQPQGYIERVNQLIQEGKLYYERSRTPTGYRPQIKAGKLTPEEEGFLKASWLREDIEAFNEGNSEVFLINQEKLRGINVYRHRVESPLASDWSWWGRVYSQSSEGYAYLWNSRRTLKLFRPSLENRSSAKLGQSEFREVVYGRGHLFQTGLGISLKGRYSNRIADVYAMGDNIVLKSYSNDACLIDGHVVAKGQEQRLEEGDLVQIYFDSNDREEFLFHDFSRKPLSFVNVLNGRITRTNLDQSFHFMKELTSGIETAVKRLKKEKKVEFDVHLALDEDLSGVAQSNLEQYVRRISTRPLRASCTILNATNGRILATASIKKREEDANENFRLHPVGSATKIFLAAAALQNYPDLLGLEVGPHPAGEEKNLLGYQLNEGYKLRLHSPFVGEAGNTDFSAYLAKSCNHYHAILMALALAKDSAAASNSQNLIEGISFTDDPVNSTNGEVYLGSTHITKRPDLGYFISRRSGGALESTNLETSELALNLERLFGVRRKYYEGSGDFFSAEPWNVLFARLGLQEHPDLYPAFYPIMPQTVNLGFNLNVDFRLDFISILFGGATNRWNNIKLAEATSRLVTNRKIEARFIERITEGATELNEKFTNAELGLNPQVHSRILQGMEGVCVPGGTAGDLYPLLQNLKSRTSPNHSLEFYGKTGTPFRKEHRLGAEELYSSAFLFTAILRDRATNQIKDGLTFSIYIEDLGEHKAVDFLKSLLPRVLAARTWVQ